MDHATDKSVLGDFNDASFDYYGVHSRFFRKDGKFLVETDGPDGKLATFEVKYTFGVYPLQQYLIEFPDGRIQALSIAWDSRPKEQGGQRWFHLYPNEEIKHDDILHWTKLNQNWNFMCAECHSTGVRKNYDAANDRFDTTWAEISVGCETCHGQGSHHVAWARDQQTLVAVRKARGQVQGARRALRRAHAMSPGGTIRKPATRSAISTPPVLRKEVETCGLCHARRAEFSEDWVPGQWLSDTHVVSGLSRGLYYADGQMQDEVYNYGSFKQSKMFAAGVTCSDCHDPHSDKLKVSGDGVCLQCHASDKYAAAAHNHHEAVNPPSPARRVTCRRAPTWSSIRGTITVCAFRGRTCRRSSARPTPATIATRTNRPLGRRRHRELVRAEPGGFSELRRSIPCGVDRSAGRCEASCSRGRRSQRRLRSRARAR